MLTINNLKKAFDDNVVLDSLDWTINKGKIYGLIGANGSGKSTLLRCIAGVYQSDGGTIELHGKPVYNNPRAKKEIVFLSDEPFYFAQSTLKDMKLFFKMFYPNFDEDSYQHLLKIFHFDENKRIQKMSKGLKRQSALIISLSMKPEILLMDESFDGLDPMMRLALKKHLAQSVLDDEMTVIISSHNIRELEDICDNMSLLDHKKLVFSSELSVLQSGYHKIQIGFNKDVHIAELKMLNPLYVEQTGRIFTVIIKGDADPFIAKVEELEPVLINPIPLSMEELFVREMEVNLDEIR